jgi:hypothetical protein
MVAATEVSRESLRQPEQQIGIELRLFDQFSPLRAAPIITPNQHDNDFTRAVMQLHVPKDIHRCHRHIAWQDLSPPACSRNKRGVHERGFKFFVLEPAFRCVRIRIQKTTHRSATFI